MSFKFSFSMYSTDLSEETWDEIEKVWAEKDEASE